jgi:hypothetical protein
VRSDRYFHVEFGYFCPTPRLRRELRVACYAGLFGMAVGAASVIALGRMDGAASTASPMPSATQAGAGVALSRKVATTERNDLQERAAPLAPEAEAVQGTPTRRYEFTLQSNAESRRHNRDGGEAVPRPYPARATKARSHANQRDNGPELARIPLGRPVAFESGTPSSAEADSATVAALVPADSSAAATVAASAAPRALSALPEPPRAAYVLEKPHGMVRVQTQPQKQQSESGRMSSGSGNEFGGSTHARDTAFPRTVFWDWSR